MFYMIIVTAETQPEPFYSSLELVMNQIGLNLIVELPQENTILGDQKEVEEKEKEPEEKIQMDRLSWKKLHFFAIILT